MKFKFVQFHAAPDELIKLGFELADFFHLHCICINLKNDDITTSLGDFAEKYTEGVQGFEFLLILLEPHQNDEMHTAKDFKANKKIGVYIEVGAANQGKLMESSIGFSKEEIGFKSIDPSKVIAKFKKHTELGAIAFNVNTGAESMSKTHRYTKGAKALQDLGFKIIPFGGGKTVFFKLT